MELKQYFLLLRQWAWLIGLGVLLAGGTAYAAGKNTAPVYRASIHLLINQAPGESGSEFTQIQVSERLTRTYSELIKKWPVLEETAATLDLPFGPGSLVGKITVSSAPNTQIMVVSVEDTDRGQAALIANTLVEVFVAQNQEFQSARYAQAIASWEAAVEEVGLLVENLEQQIAAIGEANGSEQEARLARLETHLTQARASYSDTFNQLQSLRVAQAREVSNIIVVEPARAPNAPIRPRVAQNTLLAAVVGGMLALGVVFLIEYLDDTVKSPDQISQDTGLSTLGTIAVIQGDKLADKLTTYHEPRSPIAEAYRVLRTNVGFSAIDGGLRTLIVTSGSPDEGKTTTTANLAVAMAQAGKEVIVVDADLRRPRLHNFFQAANNQGLTTALLDSEAPAASYCRPTAVPGLRLLSSGPLPPNPAELLSSQRMHLLVESLQAEADLVIFDTPPVLMVADASILAAQVAGCLLVAGMGETRRDALAQAAETLHKAGATLYGVVLNRARSGRSGYYYYHYRNYNHDYDYARAGRPSRKWLPAWVATWLGRSG
jgi:capsular exopolysaccharide synthesis family protein